MGEPSGQRGQSQDQHHQGGKGDGFQGILRIAGHVGILQYRLYSLNVLFKFQSQVAIFWAMARTAG